MSDAKIGHGLQFKVGNAASPEVFTALAEVTGINIPNVSKDSVEVTHTDSSSKWREFIPGLRDAGEVQITLNMTKAAIVILNTEMAKDVTTNYQVTLPTSVASTWAFTGFITNISGDEPIGDRMTAQATFKVTGSTLVLS